MTVSKVFKMNAGRPLNLGIVIAVSLLAFQPSVMSESSESESQSIYLDFRTEAYLSWLGDFFTAEDLLDPDWTGLSVDPDGDNNSNEFEYLLKLDPSNRESRLYFSRISESPNRIKVGPIGDGIQFKLQVSSDLRNWTNFNNAVYSAEVGYLEFNLEGLDPVLFYRTVAETISE